MNSADREFQRMQELYRRQQSDKERRDRMSDAHRHWEKHGYPSVGVRLLAVLIFIVGVAILSSIDFH